MNESIKFTKDDTLYGKYAKDDTGTMVGLANDYVGRLVGVVRLDAGNYVAAPIEDLEYVSAES